MEFWNAALSVISGSPDHYPLSHCQNELQYRFELFVANVID